MISRLCHIPAISKAKKALTFLFLLTFSYTTYAQTWNTPMGHGNATYTSTTFNAVYFTSATQGWAVGFTGTISITTNGGSTWTSQTSGTTQSLRSVYFTSATQGWAVGNGGTILTTSNSGGTWTAQSSGTTQGLRSVYFTSATQGWAVGDGGTILTTSNGGSTWTSQTSGTTLPLSSVNFISATQGWAVGDGGTILTTSNGGSTWTSQTSGTTQSLTSVNFTSATQGWTVGAGGTILTTSNGGSTWTAQTSGTTQSLSSVNVTSATQGWAVGNGGTILTTTNGGSTWTAQTSGTTQTLRSVYFTSATQGWAVGVSGTILTTTNGGSTWTEQTWGTTNALRSVYFTSATQGWAVGGIGTILTTSNGGSTWSGQTSGNSQIFYSVYFTSATQGWAVGNGGTILTTSNGGSTWTAQTSGTTSNFRSVYFSSATQGWAVGEGGTILTTSNGGSTWTAQTSGTTNTLNSVYFTSATQGWAVGANGTILTTSNGGSTWAAQTSGTTNLLFSVYFTSATQGWAVGTSGTIRTTTDGGSNWTAQTSGTSNTLFSVYFTSTTLGWAVGFNGTILTTNNGGSTWTAQTSGTTNALNSVYFTSATQGWAVGASGTILIYKSSAPPTPTVNLSVSSTTGSEASLADITVTATASAAVSADETVTLTVSGTNITTGDYTLNAMTQNTVTITILSGNTTGTATFRVVDDAIYEGPTDEIAVLTLSNPSSGITLGSTVTQNLTIIENDLPCHPSNIIYVNDDASGANNGTSWTDAFTDLQSALTLASTCNLVNQIWVAAGTYKPTSTTNRSVYFAMRNNLAIYGGFNGTESSIGARNITANETILSGDIGTIGVATDNSYHIFRNDNLDNTAILNGFTLRDGYGLQTNAVDGYGAAMLHLNSNPIIKNCKFINNQCYRGGACFSNANVAAIVYDSCTFIDNKVGTSIGNGGAINQAGNAKITITNSLFMGNEATQGGAIYLEPNGANLVIDNTTFDNNKARFGGAVEASSNLTMNISNSIFKNNRGYSGGAAIDQFATSTFEKCQFFNNLCQSNDMTIGTGGAFQISGTESAIFTNTTFYNNQAIGSIDDGGGHIMIYGGTVNLMNCTLAEGNTTSQGGSVSLINNTCTLNATNTIFSHSTATSSNPIIAKRTGIVNLTNCLFDLPCPTDVTCTGSVVNKDPLYTDVSSNDLTLTACSPAINAGTNAGAPATDIINTARPQFTTVDVGAYESTVAPLPKASLALSVTTLAENDPSTEQVIVNVDQAVSGPQTIDVTVSGTNITTGDYLLNNMTQSTFTITVPNGSMMSTAAFNIVNDVLPEGTEKAYFTLSNPSSGICIVDPKVDSMILEDNDPIAKNFNTNTTYYSLQDAINDAVDGQLIMLLYDISESNLTISNSVIIEADGHLLTIPSGTLSIPSGKSLTWKEDTLIIGPAASIDNDGTLKNNGTINYQSGSGTFNNTGAYSGIGSFEGNFMNKGVISPGN